MTKTKAEKRELMLKSIKETLAGRKTGWAFLDSGHVAIKLIGELPDKDGNPTQINDELRQIILDIFDARKLLMEALKAKLAEANCTLDATTQAQLMQLLDTEELRKQLISAKLLTKKPRSTKKKLKDLMEEEDEVTVTA